MSNQFKRPGSIGLLLFVALLMVTMACASQQAAPRPGGEQAAPKAASERPAQVVVQTQAAPAPALAPGQPSGWDTKFSQLIGVKQLAKYDSGGPEAWNPTLHPLVYVTSEGPGYGAAAFGGAFMSQQTKTPGLSILDANSRQPVASAHYETDAEPYGENHGLGASGDGRYFYTQGKFQGKDALLVINAKTLKIEQILSSRVHHARAYQDAATKKYLVLVDGWGSIFALDPSEDNRVVGAVDPNDIKGSAYLGFVDPSGKWLLISTRTGFNSKGGVAVVDLKTWKVVTRINTEDNDPIWVTFSDVQPVAYVSNGHESTVAKIDMSKPDPNEWDVVALTNAGTIGPYGLALSWDEQLLVATGKGEASHNQGISVGLMKTQQMTTPPHRYRGWGADVAGTVNTGCLRGDHGILHPDPKANELWISCNSSFENVIFDLEKLTVKARVPMPNGGSTHNGAFVRYGPDWQAELLSDTNGLHNSAREQKRQIAAKAKPAAPAQAQPAAAAPATQVQEIPITQVGNMFKPAQVTVKAGTPVRLVLRNEDPEAHNIVSLNPSLKFPDNTQAAGATGRVEFTAPTQPGTYDAICAFHAPGMAIKIVVQ